MGLATVIIRGGAKGSPAGYMQDHPQIALKKGGIIWLYVGRDVGTAVEYYLSN
jgi:hypothetical protein